MNITKTTLEKVKEICDQGFENADKLLETIEKLIKLLRKK